MKNNITTIKILFLCFIIFIPGTTLFCQNSGIVLFGDVNSDGVVDIIDALRVAQFYVGIFSGNFNENTADVNMDMSIDIVDALLIARKYVGLIPLLPGEELYEIYQKELSGARELWESLGIKHYEYIFAQSCFCPDSGREYRVEVKDNIILSITDTTDNSILPEDLYAYYFTITGLFDLVQEVMDKKEHLRDLKFNDPYGHPTSISVDALVMAMDDEYSYTIKNMMPLHTIRIIPSSTNTQQGDPFGLQDVKITGDIITLSLEYSGGCMEHTIELFASDAFMESFPPQVDCFIRHDDPGDPCDAIIMETIGIGLIPLADLYKEMYRTTGTLLLNVHDYNGEQVQVEYQIRE